MNEERFEQLKQQLLEEVGEDQGLIILAERGDMANTFYNGTLQQLALLIGNGVLESKDFSKAVFAGVKAAQDYLDKQRKNRNKQ